MNPGMWIGIGFIAIALLLFYMLSKEKHIDRHGTSGHMGASILLMLIGVGLLLLGLAVCFVSLLVHVF